MSDAIGGYALDKLRRTDPKSARRMLRAGNRAAQRALIEREDKMATAPTGLQRKRGPTGTGAPDRMNINLTGATRQRLNDLRGDMPVTHFIARLMDVYEAQIAKDRRIAELEDEVADVRQTLATARVALKGCTQRVTELEQVVEHASSVATTETQDVLFEIVQVLTGMTATATASGEVVVAPPPEGMAAIFGLWGRAVRALGLAKAEPPCPA